ncbi:MAG TPA: tetratricopeptide repeat protein [Myxococcales bacterium]|nr:tetratricopeptide repeat protein [Myxococcales bacterium]
MMNVHEILEKARAAGHRLPYNEAAVLFAAAVRLAAAQGSTVRGRLVQIDEAGGLHVEAFDENAPEAEPGYLAPELLAADAPPRTDPRVQVYAAGALGYELLTGKLAPQPGQAPGPELSGALGDVVRIALAPDRRARFGDLKQLHDAVEVVQPRPPSEGERNILSALRMRFSRPPPEKEAVARLIEKLHQLEGQVAQLGKAQARLEATHQQSLEMLDRFEDGQRRLNETGRRKQSVVAPAVLAAVFTTLAVLAAAWGLGMRLPLPVVAASQPEPVATPAVAPPPPEAPLPPVEKARVEKAPAEKPPAEKPPVPDASVAEVTPAPPDAGAPAPDAGAVAIADAGEVDAGAAVAAEVDAGPPPVAAAPAQPPPPSIQRKPAPPNPRAAMQRALAVSQVRHGEAALEQGRPDEALGSFRAALESEPTLAAAFRGMGMAYAMQGHDAQALQSYDRYLRLAPGAADAAEIRQSIRELRARAKVGSKQQ